MRKYFLAMSCILLVWGTMAMSVMVDDFEKPSTWFVYKGDERGGSIAYVPAPEGKGQAGKFSWQASHFSYLELHLDQPVTLTDFSSECDGTIAIRVYSEGTTAIRNMNLRLVDAKGEVFQINKPVSLAKKGWQDFVYTIYPNGKYDSWGNANKVFDLPVRLLGFAFEFNPNTPAGSIYLDNIFSVGPGKKVAAHRQLWNFVTDGPMQKTAADTIAQWTQTKSNTRLTIAPTTKDVSFSILDRALTLKALGKPTEITLNADLLAGDGVAVAMRLLDAKGEYFDFQPKNLGGGSNTLTWNLGADKFTTSGANKDGVIDYPVYLQEFRLLRVSGEDKVNIDFHAIAIRSLVSITDAVNVDVETGNPIHVLKVGDEAKLALTFKNTALTPVSFVAQVRLEDLFGNTVPVEKKFTLAAQETAAWQMPKMPKLGIWFVNYTLNDLASDTRTANRLSFCYMQPAGPTQGLAKGFILGVCSHPERWGNKDLQREALAAALCGAKTLRSEFVGWQSVQPTPDTWNFTTFDKLVDAFWQQGVEVQYLFLGTAKWAARPNGDTRNVPADMNTWAKYVSTMAKRYQNRIRFWEIWNEPDIGFYNGTEADYLTLMQTAYREIKAVNPKLQVMTGGYATLAIHPGQKPNFIENTAVKGQNFYDILAIHIHGPFLPFRDQVDGKLAPIRKELNPAKPLYFNETAVTSVDDAQRMQADTLVKKVSFAWSRGAMAYQWYDLRNDGYNPKDGEHNYGLLTNDFYPKAVYAAYNTFAQNFRDKQFKKQLDLGNGRWGFIFAGPTEQIVTAWDDNTGASENLLILQTDAQQAFRMDIMGNKTPVAITKGCVILPIAATPGYLVLNGAKTLPTLTGTSLVTVKAVHATVPGDTQVVSVQLSNPLAAPVAVDASWIVPAPLQGKAEKSHMTIPAHGTVMANLQLAAPQNMVASYGEVRNLKFAYQFTGMPWTGTIDIPIVTAAYIHDGNTERNADFVLEDRSHIFNLCENDPNTAHLTWQGPNDLSARIWLGRTANAMTMRVAVRDDKFFQPNTGGDVWKADGIQFAFQVPGQDGYWELGLTRLADGAPSVYTWTTPKGFADPTAHTVLKTTQVDGGVIYEATLPFADFGLANEKLENGIRFNLIVNDNDGEAREGWVQISRGIGDTKDPSYFPIVIFEKKNR
ncbi:MAG TPA: beta-galactosidase [Armatimonadota bacterium]|nr:beta-galactosidase [Armatimonadota bacterium]